MLLLDPGPVHGGSTDHEQRERVGIRMASLLLPVLRSCDHWISPLSILE
jgi:hypothetical protein